MVGLVVAAGAGIYLARTTIGVRLAQDYLAKRGIPSALVIDRLDTGGLAGRLRVGPADDPDLTAERIEVEFEPVPILKLAGSLPRIRSIRLVKPRLKAKFDGKRFTVGSLQPLIDEALAKPGAGPGPAIRIEGAEARIDSWAGLAVVTGDATIDNGRLVRARLKMPTAVLTPRPGMVARIAAADLALDADAARLVGRLNLRLDRLEGPATITGSTLALGFDLPYGAQGFARLDGPVNARADMIADSLSGAGAGLRSANLTLDFKGASQGPLNALVLDGALRNTLQAAALDAGGGRTAQKLNTSTEADGVHWRNGRLAVDRIALRASADAAKGAGLTFVRPSTTLNLAGAQATLGAKSSASAQLDAALYADRASDAASTATLPKLVVRAAGDVALGGAARWNLTGSAAAGRGSLAAKPAETIAEGFKLIGEPAVIAAALRSFDLSAPAWTLQGQGGDLRFALAEPVTLKGANGVEARLTGAATKPLLALRNGAGNGGFAFTLAGAGAPKLDITVADYRLGRGGIEADTKLALGFSTDLLHETVLTGAGKARIRAGSFSFAPTDCLSVAAAQIGTPKGGQEALMVRAHARFCGAASPMVTADARGWTAQGRIEDAAGALPSSEAALDQGRGDLILAGRMGRTTGRLQITGARVQDVGAEKRFHPLLIAGPLSTEGGDWTGTLTVSDAAKNRPVAQVAVRQAADKGEGSADITAALAFRTDGLQPRDLTPLADDLISKVEADARFTGRVAWSETGEPVSSGRFTTDGAAFKTSVGTAKGAAARIDFSNLIPLTAAPGQSFTVASIAGITPLTDVATAFSMNEAGLELSDTRAVFASGKASIAMMFVPFDDKATLTGRLKLEKVDLGELVAASSLADQVKLDARIDGEIPFTIGPAGARIEEGVLISVGAGRLSIKREALTGAVATSGADGAQPSAVQDFAYQALENLAFDGFDARIASRPGGRLGAIFHIKGRNDPPGNVEARIALTDLLSGHAFDKPISLPKGTPIDLTLDTSLNFDELLKAYGELGQNRSSGVQP